MAFPSFEKPKVSRGTIKDDKLHVEQEMVEMKVSARRVFVGN